MMSLTIKFEQHKYIVIILLIFVSILFYYGLSTPVVQSLMNPVPTVIHTVQSIELTTGGKRVIGDLIDWKDVTAAEAIRQRGGGQSQVRQLQTGYATKTLAELANLAAAGDEAARTAIKIVKQAWQKAQKYGGK